MTPVSQITTLSLNPKRVKTPAVREEEISNSVLFNAIQNLTCKFDTQSEHFQAFECQMKENTDTAVKIKESVDANTPALKGIIDTGGTLRKENAALQEACLEHARYKHRWSYG